MSLEDVLLSHSAVEVSAMDVYSDMFRLGKGFIQKSGEPPGEHKANPIVLGSFGGSMRRCVLFEDAFEETLQEFRAPECEWAIVNGLTYWGRANTAGAQSKMCAMVFDLDGQDDETLGNFLHGCLSDPQVYPCPRYVTLSGTNVHLYYVLDEPLGLYPNTKLQLKQLKYALTDRMWNMYTSRERKPQHQGINQGFRAVGTRTKQGGTVRAFRLGGRSTLAELNSFVPVGSRVDGTRRWRESRMSLAEAAERFPEWYRRVVVGGAAPGTWVVKEDLYEWWKRQVREGAAPGHRYFCVMAMAIFAAKCGITDEARVRADAMALMPFMNALAPGDPFTERDVDSALECLDLRYARFPRDDIARLTAIPIKANKRNGQKQPDHLEEARAIRDIRQRRKGTHWWDGGNRDGAPTKRDLVRSYVDTHPGESQREVARALGVSPTTVNKWLKGYRAGS